MRSPIPSPSNSISHAPDVDEILVIKKPHDARGIFMDTWSIDMLNSVNGVHCKEQLIAEILLATGFWE